MIIAELREAAGLTQRDLAERVGMSAPTLSRIESGQRDATSGEIALISAALAAEVSEDIPGEALEPAVEPEEAHLAPYPGAPVALAGRQAWAAARNLAFQTAKIPAPASGTYGSQPKGKKP